jgi:hypothetical protein
MLSNCGNKGVLDANRDDTFAMSGAVICNGLRMEGENPRNLRRSANGKSNRGLQNSMIFGTAPLSWTQWRAELDIWCQTRTWTVFFEKLQKFLWWRRPIHEQPRVRLTAHSSEIEPGNIWERLGNGITSTRN